VMIKPKRTIKIMLSPELPCNERDEGEALVLKW